MIRSGHAAMVRPFGQAVAGRGDTWTANAAYWSFFVLRRS